MREFTPATDSSALALVLASLAVDPSKHNHRERVLYAEVRRLQVIEQRAKDATHAAVAADMNALQAVWQVARYILSGDGSPLAETTDDEQPMFPATWAGMMAFLDEKYPAGVFPETAAADAGDDLGPRMVRLARELTRAHERQRAAEEEVHRVVAAHALCDAAVRAVANDMYGILREALRQNEGSYTWGSVADFIASRVRAALVGTTGSPDDQGARTDLGEAESIARVIAERGDSITADRMAVLLAEYDRRGAQVAVHKAREEQALHVRDCALDLNVESSRQLAAVRALHEPDDDDNCIECDGYDGKNGGRKVEWPCPTIAALDGAGVETPAETGGTPETTGHMIAPGVPCHGCQICLVPDCEKCAVGDSCADHDPTDDEVEPVPTRVMHLSDVEDWEALAAQVGGHVHTERDISDEYVSELVIPGVSGNPVRLRESDALLIIDKSAGSVSTTPAEAAARDENRARLREVLDALGMAGTRDWDDVLNALRCMRKAASVSTTPDPAALARWLYRNYGGGTTQNGDWHQPPWADLNDTIRDAWITEAGDALAAALAGTATPPASVEVPRAKTCGLCGHVMTMAKCGEAAVVDGGFVRPLCHHDSHDCYHRWTVYGVRPVAGPSDGGA